MEEIRTFEFTPISNKRQQIHTISFSERIRKGGEGVLKPHRTNFYILLFVTHGCSKHMIDFEVFDIRTGDFIIIRPGQVHAFYPSVNSDGTIIAFTDDFLLQRADLRILSDNMEALSELSIGCHFSLRANGGERIDRHIQMIQQELCGAYDELQESILQKYLSSLLLGLLRIKRGDGQLFAENSKARLYALKFKCLIEKSCKMQLTVSQLAEEVGISKRSLQRLTELHFGKTPKLMIQESLLLESKRMLIDPSRTVKEISYDLGFNEPTNFTKFFKKFTCMSPEQFRKSRP
jgi:AraC family transcriptional regulator, transcriptional activator of pobA